MNFDSPVMKDSFHLGFGVTRAENGAWVLTEPSDYEKAKHYVCADAEALYSQMRAWVEREIVAHRNHEKVVGGHITYSDTCLTAGGLGLGGPYLHDR